MPSIRRVLVVAGRALRLRCPNCGRGAVIKGFDSVRDHCSACGFRYTRSDDHYFSGAMFFGLLLGEGLAVLGIALTIAVTWPNVPWDRLQFGAPLVLLAVMIAVFPLSKVIWLAVDVLVRPVQESELIKPPA
jgi:uncharacterized protein (DUF983 family)